MKIAAFVCLENVFHPEWLKRNLAEIEGLVCYFSNKAGFDLETLCTGVDASYQDYDYVLLLNAPERGEHEPLQLYASRQRYYLTGLISTNNIFRKTIELLEKNQQIGAVTLPLDLLQIENWENYENWSDYYYLISRWIKRNGLRVPVSKDKPPVLSCPMALIRTEAIRGIEKLNYKVYAASFLAYSISLYCQSRGYLPHYVVPKDILVNNYLGFEDFTSIHKDMLKTKQEYYRQNEAYKKTHMDWQAKRIITLEDQLVEREDRQRLLEGQIVNLENQIASQSEKIFSLQNQLNDFYDVEQQLESIRLSTSWRITAPLRAMVNAIHGKG